MVIHSDICLHLFSFVAIVRFKNFDHIHDLLTCDKNIIDDKLKISRQILWSSSNVNQISN